MSGICSSYRATIKTYKPIASVGRSLSAIGNCKYWDDNSVEREIGAFVKLKNFIGDATCLLITNSEEEELDYEGVHVSVVPVWKWLLQNRKQDI